MKKRLYWLCLFLSLTGALYAGDQSHQLVTWYNEGGLFMWPITCLAFLGILIIVERYRTIRINTLEQSDALVKLLAILNKRSVKEAFDFCKKNEKKSLKMSFAMRTLERFVKMSNAELDINRIDFYIKENAEGDKEYILAKMEKNLGWLMAVATIAPSLGFLGTVQGMIIAFGDIVAMAGEGQTVLAAAEGIQVALLTTCFGLMVGLPCQFMHHYFYHIIDKQMADLDSFGSELKDALVLAKVS